MTSLLAAVSTSEPGQVVVGQFDRTQDGELLLFIDRAIVPMLLQRWLEQSGESGLGNATAEAEELPAAA